MASTNPARGMRDFLPADVRKRDYVLRVIKQVYESYGFEPLETPSVENLETLMGKYGDEGNQLVFKILKRGEKLDLANASKESDLSDLALRYDLTVPLARVVANNKNDLPKFFKRYQIQPVWRADRPARGRFREFYQCDVDSIGSNSLVVEAEIISAASEILTKLGFHDFIVTINHRELLFAVLEIAEIPAEFHATVIAVLDKLDKIGPRAVAVELEEVGISKESQQKLFWFLADLDDGNTDLYTRICNELAESLFKLTEADKAGDENLKNALISEALRRNATLIDRISKFACQNERGSMAVSDLNEILRLLGKSEKAIRVVHNVGLARGLSYYTGTILEIVLTDGDFKGSIGGGGRYDGLIGMFGKEQIPACGFSLGLERILVVMEERGMFPPEIAESTPADVLVTIFSEDTVPDSLKLANELRANGLRVTLYPEADKLGKQFKYADQIKVPFVCVIGPEEAESGLAKVKNLQTGEELTGTFGDIASFLRK